MISPSTNFLVAANLNVNDCKSPVTAPKINPPLTLSLGIVILGVISLNQQENDLSLSAGKLTLALYVTAGTSDVPVKIDLKSYCDSDKRSE